MTSLLSSPETATGLTELPLVIDAAAVEPFTPAAEKISAEIDQVLSLSLSEELQAWVERYSSVGLRHSFLWNWCRRGVEVTTLGCVRPDLCDELCDTKVLGVMLDVLLDDVADQGGEASYLETLLTRLESRCGTLPAEESLARVEELFNQLDAEGDESARKGSYTQLIGEVWDDIWRRLRQYPRFEEFAQLLAFDYRQLFNAMRYSSLINRDARLLNLAEHDLYLPHNMHMMVSSTIDLMASPGFDRRELGRLREAILNAQMMGRIGNLVTTWQRELGDRDFTSGVFALALSRGDVTAEQLADEDVGALQTRIGVEHETFFLQRWQVRRWRLLELAQTVQSVDLSGLVRGLERLICLHLGSRGRK